MVSGGVLERSRYWRQCELLKGCWGRVRHFCFKIWLVFLIALTDIWCGDLEDGWEGSEWDYWSIKDRGLMSIEWCTYWWRVSWRRRRSVWMRNSCPQLLMHFRVCQSPRCQSLVPFWLYPLACIRGALKVRWSSDLAELAWVVRDSSLQSRRLMCSILVSPLWALRIPL
jgi:hypothetical protein